MSSKSSDISKIKDTDCTSDMELLDDDISSRNSMSSTSEPLIGDESNSGSRISQVVENFIISTSSKIVHVTLRLHQHI